jgi:hypothetical protein
VARAHDRATASAAALFLGKLVADMQFEVRAIPVDGGNARTTVTAAQKLARVRSPAVP